MCAFCALVSIPEQEKCCKQAVLTVLGIRLILSREWDWTLTILLIYVEYICQSWSCSVKLNSDCRACLRKLVPINCSARKSKGSVGVGGWRKQVKTLLSLLSVIRVFKGFVWRWGLDISKKKYSEMQHLTCLLNCSLGIVPVLWSDQILLQQHLRLWPGKKEEG